MKKKLLIVTKTQYVKDYEEQFGKPDGIFNLSEYKDDSDFERYLDNFSEYGCSQDDRAARAFIDMLNMLADIMDGMEHDLVLFKKALRNKERSKLN